MAETDLGRVDVDVLLDERSCRRPSKIVELEGRPTGFVGRRHPDALAPLAVVRAVTSGAHEEQRVPVGGREPRRLTPALSTDADTGARSLSWVGGDERGRELEVVAVELPNCRLVIHVMPTHYQRKKP